jgi:hypothetical protein
MEQHFIICPDEPIRSFKLDLENGESQQVLALALQATEAAIFPTRNGLPISDDDTPFEYDVFLCQMDGGNRRRLTNFRGYIGQVRFTPDSNRSSSWPSQRDRRTVVEATSMLSLLTAQNPGRLGPIGSWTQRITPLRRASPPGGQVVAGRVLRSLNG